MNRYARKVDANHAYLLGVWRWLGAYVIDCSHVGSGFPDALIGWRGQWLLAEIKDGSKPPSRRTLTADQRVLHADVLRVGCKVHVIENEAQALALLGAKAGA